VKPARFAEDALRLDLGDLLRACRLMTPAPQARWPASPGAAVLPAVPVIVTRCGVLVGRVVVDVMRTGRTGEMRIIAGPGCGTVAEMRAVAMPLIGYRWGFACPLALRRCNVLYLPPGAVTFACREAHGLIYAVTCERPAARRCRRATKLRRYLGEVPAVVTGPLPDAPAGMTERVYLRRCAEIEEAERLLEIA
jgi:hypothetical protein